MAFQLQYLPVVNNYCFKGEGGFCLGVESAQGGSVTRGAALYSLFDLASRRQGVSA